MNKSFRILFGLYFGSMVISGLLSPWVYWGVLKLSEQSSLEVIAYLAQKEFPDYFDRFRWLGVLLGLPWLIRASLNNEDSLSHFWQRIGFFAFRQNQETMIRSFLIGSFFIIFIVFIQITTGQFNLRESLYLNAWSLLLHSLLGGILISVLEEWLFRGVLFRVFLKSFSPGIAIILGSLFFAYVHFKMPDVFWESISKDVKWHTGLQVAWGTLTGLSHTFSWVEFINLTLLGIILSLWTQQSQRIWAAVGFHAGAVFIMLLAHRSLEIKGTGWVWFCGSSSIKDGILCTLILTILVFWNLSRAHKRKKAV